MAHAMNVMAATVTVQTNAKTQRDIDKREREKRDAGSRTLTQFRHQDPPKFHGEGGPDAVDLWLQELEKIFGAIHCPEGEKVTLATYQLLGDAEYWWRNTKLMMEGAYEEINWETFKRKFLAKYFPETARERYGEEFLKLRQGGITIEAYANKFESLSMFFRFFRNAVDEAYMCCRFQDGLRYEMQDAVVPLGIRQFQTLVEKCQEIEDMKNKRVNRGGNLTAGGPICPNNLNNNHGKQGMKPYQHPQNNREPNRPANSPQGNQMRRKQMCYHCGQEGHYANDCKDNAPSCYKCKKPGHYSQDCKAPKVESTLNATRGARPIAKGRVYTMDAKESGQANNVIQEECQVAGNTLTALIDTGATHSFISLDCANRLNIKISPLLFDLQVSTPAKNLVVNSTCLHCLVVIQNREFLVNLICLPLPSLEIILGMDWLSYHYVILDCTRKMVFFPEPGVVKYLSADQLRVTLREGAQEFLSLYNVEVNPDIQIENVRVVQQFQDVFPLEILGFPPIREVEFFIDLHPGIGPISYSPYRMAPTELVELKSQVEDLLEKGFIRPSVSPWGAQSSWEEEGWTFTLMCRLSEA
ncbi:uncharacterized protein LOC131597554 [Vicia villosa]|uniref:uncharacterized protein LOC131597554 n=1 Tax=Vicia villosa TaxID=3911 RepID=UPI00273BDC6F|nr:uncharacterized protein LOC131597554 [Vicia villosa]